MDHKDIQRLIAESVDRELDDKTRAMVEEHLAACPTCREEYDLSLKLEEVMEKMDFKTPPDEIWNVYWTSVYNRLERGIGWILLSLGAIIVLFFGAVKMIEGLLRHPAVPLVLKIGLLALLGGAVILLVSIAREHLFLRKRERYKEIMK